MEIIIILGVCVVLAFGLWFLNENRKYGLALRNLNDENNQIVERNRKLLSLIEVNLFNSKEHGLWLYDNYEAILKILSQIDPNDYNTLNRAMNAAKIGMDNVARQFYQQFGSTPEQYRTQKTMFAGKNERGETIYYPNIGIN